MFWHDASREMISILISFWKGRMCEMARVGVMEASCMRALNT